MAFRPDNKIIQKTLQDSSARAKQLKEQKEGIIPSKTTKEEITKHYTFTLKPSVRKKLSKIAKEQNYKSDSKFLSDLIDNIK